MNIQPMKLLEFVKRASINGIISAINMDFKTDGLHSRMYDYGKITMTQTFLSEKAFVEYEAIGELYIRDTKQFIKYLKTFNEPVSLEISEDYVLKIADSERELFMMLGAESVLRDYKADKMPEIKYSVLMPTNKATLKQVFSDMELFNSPIININKTGDKISFFVGVKGETDYSLSSMDSTVAGEAKVSVANYFPMVVDTIEEDFLMSLGTDLPLLITEELEDMKFSCIIAPRTTS